MKKKYEKPEMFMESFEVAEFIAGCVTSGAWQSFNSSENSACGYKMGNSDVIVFDTSGNVCNLYTIIPKDDPIGMELGCYHTLETKFNGFWS